MCVGGRVGDFAGVQGRVNFGLDRSETGPGERGSIFGHTGLSWTERQADELLHVLALEIPAQAGDFRRVSVQLSPDGVLEAAEQVRHQEGFLAFREAKFVVLKPSE